MIKKGRGSQCKGSGMDEWNERRQRQDRGGVGKGDDGCLSRSKGKVIREWC